MSELINRRHPLSLKGSDQISRELEALSADYVRIDERKTSDLLIFWSKYSNYLKFFDTQHGYHPGQNWSALLENDTAFLTAQIHQFDFAKVRSRIQGLFADLNDAIQQNASESTLIERFKDIQKLYLELIGTIDQWHQISEDRPPLRAAIDRSLGARIKSDFELYTRYELGFQGLGHTDYISPTIPPNLLSWQSGSGLAPIEGIYTGVQGPPLTQVKDQLNVSQSSWMKLLERTVEEMRRLSMTAGQLLDMDGQDKSPHAPHTALLLTFARLYQHLQKEINQIGEKHLWYYYHDVLRLRPGRFTPDRVFLFFELAKRQERVLLEKGTLLKAGKDDSGRPVAFQLDADVTVNRGEVAELRTVYFKKGVGQGTGIGAPTFEVNQIFVAPVANSKNGFGEDFADGKHGWRPFGKDQTDLQKDDRTMAPGRIGMVLSSPLFLLKEGARQIKVTFSLHRDSWIDSALAVELDEALSFVVSGEDGWIEPVSISTSPTSSKVEIKQGPQKELVFNLMLTPDQVPILPPTPSIHQLGFVSQHPVLKIDLNMASHPEVYEAFRHLRIEGMEIEVEVKGATQLLAQNDEGPLSISQPFFPYTFQPVPGSRFIIGHPEAFSKPLERMALHLNWLAPPSSFANHYRSYPVNIPNNHAFTCTIKVLDDYYWKVINHPEYQEEVSKAQAGACQASETESFNSGGTSLRYAASEGEPGSERKANPKFLPLMEPACYQDEARKIYTLSGFGAFVPHSIEIFRGVPLFHRDNAAIPQTIEIDFSQTGLFPQSRPMTEEPYRNGTRQGFINLELNAPDFQHQVFPQRYAITMMKNASNEQNYPIPLEPYTPRIKEITLDYSARQEIDFTSPSFEMDYIEGKIPERIWHLHPFGTEEVLPVRFSFPENTSETQQGISFSDRLVPIYFTNPEGWPEGILHIGLSDIGPSEPISLFVKVAEDTGDPDLVPPAIVFEYLRGDSWCRIPERNLIQDGTLGFLKTGIIEILIPEDATLNHSRLPSERIWIRLLCFENSGAISSVEEIRSQVATATFLNEENDLNRLKKPLPPETINSLANKDFRLKKISQPLASFEGRSAEQKGNFFRRASERLRHKGRAVNIWDYEHLVLEEFPELFKAQCISHADPRSDLAPGRVTVVVVPDTQNRSFIDPVRPRVSVAKLEEIKEFLRSRAPLCVARNIQVQNPIYEQVQVEMDLALRPGKDFFLHQNLITHEISRFMAPWAYGNEQIRNMGGEIHKSSLINLIEELPYVDYLKSFRMFHRTQTGNSGDLDHIIASTSRSILVAAPQHLYHNLNP